MFVLVENEELFNLFVEVNKVVQIRREQVTSCAEVHVFYFENDLPLNGLSYIPLFRSTKDLCWLALLIGNLQ